MQTLSLQFTYHSNVCKNTSRITNLVAHSFLMFTITSETWTSKTSLHSDPIHSKNVDDEKCLDKVYINMCAESEDDQNQRPLVMQNGYRTNITDEEL